MPEIVNAMPQNEPTGKHVHTRSRFPLQYHNFDTMRYGEYHPHFVMEGVAKDEIRFRSSHDLRSYSLKAPLMEDISMKKDYFNVPMEAILPNNWDKFFNNPVVGQDAPTDCGPSCVNFYSQYNTIFKTCTNRIRGMMAVNASFTDVQTLTAVFRYCVLGEYLFSTGSLMASLNIHTYQYFIDRNSNGVSVFFDDIIDRLFDCVQADVDDFVITDTNGRVITVNVRPGSSFDSFSLRDAIQLFREDPGASVTSVSFNQSSSLANFRADVLSYLPVQNQFVLDTITRPLNVSRLAAYQLVVAHYYTNDRIDYIFDANKYRQLLWYYYEKVRQNQASPAADYFTQNGIDFFYDSFSGYVLTRILTAVQALTSTTLLYDTAGTIPYALSYLAGIFSFKRSLRFKDYFTGSHSQPLAVGDVNVDVNTGAGGAQYVTAVDITKNIQRQRFLNAVNRAGARFDDYMREIFGSRLAPDFHNPFYLAHTSDVIFGSEVENTGDSQQQDGNSVTSVLRSNGSRYEFTFTPDRDCIVIGLTYFDVARAYTKTIDRQTMHLDRFDWFNPFMQFIGDQPIWFDELNPNVNSAAGDFAYQLRHMEYKQRYNVAAGGFVNALRGWAFLADRKYNWNNHINSDFIRSLNSELDRFYVSLSGWSLGNYFHFIIKNSNDCEASRPMAYAPTIL